MPFKSRNIICKPKTTFLLAFACVTSSQFVPSNPFFLNSRFRFINVARSFPPNHTLCKERGFACTYKPLAPSAPSPRSLQTYGLQRLYKAELCTQRGCALWECAEGAKQRNGFAKRSFARSGEQSRRCKALLCKERGFACTFLQSGALYAQPLPYATGFVSQSSRTLQKKRVVKSSLTKNLTSSQEHQVDTSSQVLEMTEKEEKQRPVFPFTAIVGQEEMKLALILNVIDPKIGGVMIMGDRGTGKSTTVRALVDLLPEIEVVLDDPFNSDPSDLEVMSKEVRDKIENNKSIETIKRKIVMVDLPLGATEDRVCGTIDIEKALTEGVKAFEPGLLAKANRGILYVDEVNLLDDHLVDVLLDSAASGWNTVERESISISHPARFILVGSGNPEEGELRPQLLDRFGMHAQIGTVKEPHLRVKIVEQRAQFDESPIVLRNQYSEAQKELSEKIKAARELRPKVEMEYDLRMKVSEVCSELNVDGLRGDIVTNRASQAIAAFEKRKQVTPQDIFRVIPLCLRHRLRKDPLESIDSGDKVKEVFKKVFGLEV